MKYIKISTYLLIPTRIILVFGIIINLLGLLFAKIVLTKHQYESYDFIMAYMIIIGFTLFLIFSFRYKSVSINQKEGTLKIGQSFVKLKDIVSIRGAVYPKEYSILYKKGKKNNKVRFIPHLSESLFFRTPEIIKELKKEIENN